MALDAAQKLNFRKFWIYDYWDAATSTGVCPYNKVNKKNFFTDTDLDAIYDMVIEENRFLLTSYIIDGITYSAQALDVLTATYRLMRIKAWQQLLVNPDFLSAMYSGGQSVEIVDKVVEHMQTAITNDREYKFNTGQYPNSVKFERG